MGQLAQATQGQQLQAATPIDNIKVKAIFKGSGQRLPRCYPSI